MSQNRNEQEQQVLGRVKRDEFIGRTAELEQLVSHAQRSAHPQAPQGLLVLSSPMAGVSELLRQTFDTLFNSNQDVVPIYFQLPQAQTTGVSAAIEFLNTFLLQYVAYRRREPALCHASLTLNDLRDLAPAADVGWIDELIESYNKHRFDEDDRELVRFCLTATRRAPADVRPFVMFDAVALSNYGDGTFNFAGELLKALAATRKPFVLAGLRRELLDKIQRASVDVDSFSSLTFGPLAVEQAGALVSSLAQRFQIALDDRTRELLVQQLESSPYLITAFLQAARDKRLALDSYFACERLYVDELLGGRLYREFSAALEGIAPDPELRATLLRFLCEAVPGGKRSVPVSGWRKRLRLSGQASEKLLGLLHVHELINWNGETIRLEGGSTVWQDFLRARFRLDALREPRALVVADLISGALKRAPQTVERHYRRRASLSLLGLLARFNRQEIPRRLFQYDDFAPLYKGAPPEETLAGLDGDPDRMRLPQVFHVASGVSFSSSLRSFAEEDVVIAHAFAGATYAERDEVVWLVARIESKLEAKASLVEQWLMLLEAVARQSGFVQTTVWLIANEGFSPEASALLRKRSAFGSSRQQFDLLSNRLDGGSETGQPASGDDDFIFILPMGGDNEFLAAITAEQIARRLEFTTEAINQIKTAVVEACINASEHSLSPERKIYQRFHVESDKLVITISSRGILPANMFRKSSVASSETAAAEGDLKNDRRSWGLRLIRTMMDEVEFEEVDEGTSLRMTKYLRRTGIAGVSPAVARPE